MASEPTLAVLIPTKNRRLLLERALKSVFGQTVPADEVIVVNDGSTDGTADYLASLADNHPRLKVINRERSGGVNAARNQGIKSAESGWVAFLDDDDEFMPEAVVVMKDELNNVTDDYVAIYNNSWIVRENEEFEGGFRFKAGQDHYDPTYEETMTKFGLKGDCKVVLRKSVCVEDGYWFPESVNGFESYFFNLLSRDGKKIRYYPQVLTRVYQLDDTYHLSDAPKKYPAGYLKLNRRMLADHRDFFIGHQDVLARKTWDMMKTAYHLKDLGLAVLLGLSCLRAKFNFFRPGSRIFGEIKQGREDD